MSTADSNHASLEQLLDEARESSPADRLPSYRDAIAKHGLEAIEPLAVWLDEPAFAAFAIRTLERAAALAPDSRTAVINALTGVDRGALPEHLVRDLDSALDRLGASPRRGSTRRASGGRSVGPPVANPGIRGRGYWAMRTSPWERPYIWAEAQRGRLRQGWGWSAEQHLDVIADAVRARHPLSEEQQMAWPSRRMLSTEADGMQVGDLILAPNLPDWGRLCVFRLIGSYQYAPAPPRRFDERFGHVAPVELLAGSIDRHHPSVSDALRTTLRNPSRLWSITPYGGDVERLAGRNG